MPEDSQTVTEPTGTNNSEVWDEEEDYDDDEDDGVDAEAEAEAEEIARRLGEELWADISKAQADRAGAAVPTLPDHVPPLQNSPAGTPSSNSPSKKEEAAILTIKAILGFVEHDLLAHSALASAVVPDSNGENVLDVLNRTVASGTIPRDVAMSLSHILVSLARSETLFGTLRHSNASSIQLDKGKRKRDQGDDGWQQNDPRAYKRPFAPNYDLQMQVAEAVRIVTQALSANTNRALDPSLVASIQLQLHQVFLFAVTSSAGGGPDMNALQEISGLIQVVGVLSGIQIGPTPHSHSSDLSSSQQSHHPLSFPSNASTTPWLASNSQPSVQITDIGTAVYPCLVPGCQKTFSRLYSLRAHQRVHAIHRPFRCVLCPASFARNHDLKRHTKLHDKKAWKCCGCDKMFSRRDAIKRHKNSNKSRGGKGEACVDAEIQEVELADHGGEEMVREERRAKIWNGISGHQGGGVSVIGPTGYNEDANLEEGEIHPVIISQVQSAVMSLHGLLQAHVGNALGTPSGDTNSPPLDPTGGQATLASVIARAQLQNLPQKVVDEEQSSSEVMATGSSKPSATPDATNSHQPPYSSDGDMTSQNLEEHTTTTVPSLSMYGLSDEQAKMLEQAIANAASAAQAQAEAEAALEEQEDGYDEEEEYADVGK